MHKSNKSQKQKPSFDVEEIAKFMLNQTIGQGEEKSNLKTEFCA